MLNVEYAESVEPCKGSNFNNKILTTNTYYPYKHHLPTIPSTIVIPISIIHYKKMLKKP